VRAPNPNH